MSDDLSIVGLNDLGVAHIDEYFRPWAMDVTTFEQIVAGLAGLDVLKHVETQRAIHLEARRERMAAGGGSGGYEMTEITADGVAVLSLTGPLMKYVSSLSSGTGTVAARRELRALAADERVRAILLRIDSPGGTVSGTDALAADVAAVNRRKPVWATIEDLGASAAYYVASQAGRVVGQPNSLVGSIGVYGVLQDTSQMASQLGIKVHVVRPAAGGDFKGMGVPGTEITADHLLEAQRIITEFHEQFVAAVSRGRKMSVKAVAALADGRVHPAAEAVSLRLLDAVETFDATLRAMRAQINSTRKEKAMSDANGTVEVQGRAEAKPATIKELRAEFANASNDFIVTCLEHNYTIAEAKDAWIEVLNQRLADSDKRAEKAEAAASKAAETVAGKPRIGAPVVPEKPVDAGADGGSATQRFEAAVQERMSTYREPRNVAWSKVCRTEPELRQAMVAEANAK